MKRLMASAGLIGAVCVVPQVGAESLEEALASGRASLDLRYRFEQVEQAGVAKVARASTLRTRLGWTSGDYRGASLHIEFDDVSVVGADRYDDATGLPTARTGYPVVADPAGTEVNQAYLRLSAPAGTVVKIGRQRIILDNARFIGNVGWRQNEQTYDALALVSRALPATTLTYGYLTNVNSIFGEASPKGDLDSRSHLLHLAHEAPTIGRLSLYGYLLESLDSPADSSATFGARLKGSRDITSATLLYTLEHARQSDYADGDPAIDAGYTLIELGLKIAGVTVKLGREVLGAGPADRPFSTPLATAHAFNGWADQFLATPANGLVDRYLSIGAQVAGTKLLARYHRFSADRGGADYGSELDLLAARPVGERYTVLLKYAAYSSDGYSADTDKLWLMGRARF